MSEQADRKTDALDVAATGAPGVAAIGAQPPRTRFAALDVRVFRWYWIASWISSTGDGMENVIRNVLVVQLAGAAAPFWLGMMVFAHWLPFTMFSLYGGVLADRYDNRKVQIVAQVLLMAAALGVASATLAGFVTTWWIFGLLLLHGFAGAIGNPAQQTLIHAMVGPSKLLSAVSLNSTARQFSQVIGPAVAGFIVVASDPAPGSSSTPSPSCRSWCCSPSSACRASARRCHSHSWRRCAPGSVSSVTDRSSLLSSASR